MRKLVLILFAMLFMQGALAEGLPSQAGLDAAQAVMAMHDAVMSEILESEVCYPELAGGDELFVLYSDAESRNFLMISLGESGDSADMAVLQSYTLAEFDRKALISLTALATPFIPEVNRDSFEEWRDATAQAVAAAAADGADLELTYYTGEYIACAMSVYHDATGPMFTALVSWHEPLTAEAVTARMESLSGETEEADDGE